VCQESKFRFDISNGSRRGKMRLKIVFSFRLFTTTSRHGTHIMGYLARTRDAYGLAAFVPVFGYLIL